MDISTSFSSVNLFTQHFCSEEASNSQNLDYFLYTPCYISDYLKILKISQRRFWQFAPGVIRSNIKLAILESLLSRSKKLNSLEFNFSITKCADHLSIDRSYAHDCIIFFQKLELIDLHTQRGVSAFIKIRPEKILLWLSEIVKGIQK